MSLPNININLRNGNASGLVSNTDGVCGLLASGVAIAGTLELGKDYPLYSLADAKKIGIDKTYDQLNKSEVYRHIQEFYDEAGEGSKLILRLYSHLTTMTDACSKSNPIAYDMLSKSNGEIKVLGVVRTPEDTYTVDNVEGIDKDVLGAIKKAQDLAVQMTGVSKDGTGKPTGNYMPVHIILEGRNYNQTVSNIRDLRNEDSSHVSVCIASTKTDGSASVGLLLGRISKVPVQRNIARVKDGTINGILEGYLSSGEKIEDIETGKLNDLHDKGYIIFRKFPSKSGYYFNDDNNCVALTDDYNSISRQRVIGKVIRLVYSTHINELNNEIKLTSDGIIEPTLVKYWEENIKNAINIQMTANNEISAFDCDIDVNQDVIANQGYSIEMKIVPISHGKEIKINLGFYKNI